jgi:hypothetical protein
LKTLPTLVQFHGSFDLAFQTVRISRIARQSWAIFFIVTHLVTISGRSSDMMIKVICPSAESFC